MSRVIMPTRMTVDSPLQSFEEVLDWLNRTPKPRENKGHPTLVHFWSISSEESKINLAQTAELRDQRKREGVRVIAVHVPLHERDKDKRVLRDAIVRLNLTEPCALDNDNRVREAFEHKQDILPAYYLFDIEGQPRTTASDSNGFEEMEDQLDQLLQDLRSEHPFCPMCELYLDKDAMFCSECGLPLILPGSQTHPYYEHQHSASLPTIRLVNPDPLIGHVIEGKYELTARLGEGGMSVVYRARRIHIGDEVAVKIMQRKFVSDEAALTRFRREARAAAMLHHPNVITIHDFGETGEDKAPAFIVMEFVKGTPLRDLLNSEGRLSVERGLRLMRGICAGIGAAHRQGVVHRDVKPENIIVLAPHHDEQFETVRVLDFGLAKLLADAHTGTVVGTPYYMSPEQCLGETLDPRSDVYSLGAMLYEMLSGKRPFVADTVSGNVNKHLYEEPPPLSEGLNIPRRVSATIMRALAKNPDERPQNASEFARQLGLI
jgi:tRNA A-37 threonylcarbamoyl transferase component Bud32